MSSSRQYTYGCAHIVANLAYYLPELPIFRLFGGQSDVPFGVHGPPRVPHPHIVTAVCQNVA